MPNARSRVSQSRQHHQNCCGVVLGQGLGVDVKRQVELTTAGCGSGHFSPPNSTVIVDTGGASLKIQALLGAIWL
jgi:hypothetical protein